MVDVCALLTSADFESVLGETIKERKPRHVNYLLLGNSVPHLHVHVVPWYLDDSAPGMPLPWAPSLVPEDVFDRQFTQLRDLSREPNR